MTRDAQLPQPIPLDIIESRAGLDVLRGMIDASLPQPPISKALDSKIVEASNGAAAFVCIPL